LGTGLNAFVYGLRQRIELILPQPEEQDITRSKQILQGMGAGSAKSDLGLEAPVPGGTLNACSHRLSKA
jgi:hypothetical protein